MCGRLSQAYTWGEIYVFSQPLTVPAESARNQQVRYNIGLMTLVDIIMKPPELREWIVNRRMNKTGVGDDDPATVAPAEPETFAAAQTPEQGDLF